MPAGPDEDRPARDGDGCPGPFFERRLGSGDERLAFQVRDVEPPIRVSQAAQDARAYSLGPKGLAGHQLNTLGGGLFLHPESVLRFSSARSKGSTPSSLSGLTTRRFPSGNEVGRRTDLGLKELKSHIARIYYYACGLSRKHQKRF